MMTQLCSIEEIVKFLRLQADLRAPENDLAGVLQHIADSLVAHAHEIEPECFDRGY